MAGVRVIARQGFLPIQRNGVEVGRMRIEQVVVRRVRLPLLFRFEISCGVMEARECLLVEVRSEGLSGWGECVADVDPFYQPETNQTAGHALRDFLVPLARRAPVDDPFDLARMMAPVRGHRMAKAALEMACWDWFARSAGEPLWRTLRRRAGAAATATAPRIPVGISIGIQQTVGALAEGAERALGQGYRRIKIKIRPGWDVEPVRALRRALGDFPLMVDANSAYGLEDVPMLRELDGEGLTMIEQPLAWDDIVDHAQVQPQLRTPICLDESIRHVDDVRHALDLGACRVINVKAGRVGGLAEVLRIHEICVRREVPLWCGGMLETGVGRAHNLALTALPRFTLPGDTSDSRRYFAQDITDPPVETAPDGTISLLERPGIGYDPDPVRVAQVCLDEERL